MRSMDKITFCIPSKSNLRYLKTCIPSIRKNSYRKDHDIIVFVDSDTDGTIEWLKKNADYYNITYYINPFLNERLFGIGKAYDYCIEKSNTDICMIFHADMMLGKDADFHAYKHLENKVVVCSTRIEPPIHPNAGEKILKDFGMWPEEYREQEFNEFVEVIKEQNRNKTTTGIFAPWMINKIDLLDIGGHDPMMHSAREDSDLFNRMKLAGYKFIQSWDSLVYHLTGRGGQFQHGKVTQDEHAKSAEWRKLMENSTKEFIRKWGGMVKHTPLMDPIISPKYNIAIVVKNTTLQLLEALEPWCDRIYVSDLFDYVEKEQENTKYDLTKRVIPLINVDPVKDNDIVIDIDARTFNQEDYRLLSQIAEIIKDSGDIGTFEIGNMILRINKIEELQEKLVRHE
jgi:glycosyltransferase involved in cell wall biosynthesis